MLHSFDSSIQKILTLDWSIHGPTIIHGPYHLLKGNTICFNRNLDVLIIFFLFILQSRMVASAYWVIVGLNQRLGCAKVYVEAENTRFVRFNGHFISRLDEVEEISLKRYV